MFVIGTPFYQNVHSTTKSSDKGNILSQTIGTIFSALKNRLNSPSEKKETWLFAKKNKQQHLLDFASSSYSSETIANVKIFCRLVLVFTPLSVFWACFNQQTSKWIVQAQQLDGRLGAGWFTIKPDQLQAVNPIVVLLLVPVFDFAVYPLFAKFSLLKKKLQRIFGGLLFGIASFLVAAYLQYRMEVATAQLNPTQGVRVLNLSPCNLTLGQFDQNSNSSRFLLHVHERVQARNFESNLNLDNHFGQLNSQHPFILIIASSCRLSEKNNELLLSSNSSFRLLPSNSPKTLIFFFNTSKNSLDFIEYAPVRNKATTGSSNIRFVTFDLDDQSDKRLTPTLESRITAYHDRFPVRSLLNCIESWRFNRVIVPSYTAVDYSDYELTIQQNSNLTDAKSVVLNRSYLRLDTTSRYTVLLFQPLSYHSNSHPNLSLDCSPGEILLYSS